MIFLGEDKVSHLDELLATYMSSRSVWFWHCRHSNHELAGHWFLSFLDAVYNPVPAVDCSYGRAHSGPYLTDWCSNILVTNNIPILWSQQACSDIEKAKINHCRADWCKADPWLLKIIIPAGNSTAAETMVSILQRQSLQHRKLSYQPMTDQSYRPFH